MYQLCDLCSFFPKTIEGEPKGAQHTNCSAKTNASDCLRSLRSPTFCVPQKKRLDHPPHSSTNSTSQCVTKRGVRKTLCVYPPFFGQPRTQIKKPPVFYLFISPSFQGNSTTAAAAEQKKRTQIPTLGRMYVAIEVNQITYVPCAFSLPCAISA